GGEGGGGGVATSKRPRREGEGRIAGTVGVSRDVPGRHQAEEELRASEQRTRLILDTANDAFVAMSSDGVIIDWNRQAEATFGWTRAEAIGRVLADTIIPPHYRAAHTRGLQRY